ncbi:MAG: hypothetical protein V9G19_27710 [Tetrasphaera sp.]
MVWWRIHAITAASARSATGMRSVRATVPLPTGVACAVAVDGVGQQLTPARRDGDQSARYASTAPRKSST